MNAELKTQEELELSIPSISSAAMLVEFNIKTWSARRLDKSASSELTQSKHARQGSARVNKSLLYSCSEMDDINKHVSRMRDDHYRMTMPWSDSGLRLLTTAQYFDYVHIMSGHEQEFRRLVDKFIQAYPWEITKAQINLGDMFNPDDYPDSSTIERKFSVSIGYIPLPDSGDFRLDINNQAMGQLKNQYEQYFSERLDDAMQDIWRRLHEILTRMSDRLGYKDDGKKKVFQNTMLEHAEEMAGLLKTCNVTQDPAMERARQDLVNALRGVSTDVLRNDDSARTRTKQAVDDLIKGLPTIGME